MSSVGILAWKSALADGLPFAVPDFRSESSRAAFEKDDWSPFPSHAKPGQPPPSILGTPDPTPQGSAHARAVWAEHGYRGE
jgi:hypothetical protein